MTYYVYLILFLRKMSWVLFFDTYYVCLIYFLRKIELYEITDIKTVLPVIYTLSIIICMKKANGGGTVIEFIAKITVFLDGQVKQKFSFLPYLGKIQLVPKENSLLVTFNLFKLHKEIPNLLYIKQSFLSLLAFIST